MVTIKFTNSLVLIEHNNGNGSVENSRSRQTRRPMIRCYNHVSTDALDLPNELVEPSRLLAEVAARLGGLDRQFTPG